ncbi:MAG: type II toxin-antitoxin system VapC family toxin [Verrucomicrobiota bacterium]|nr:type II toxin-antitoxin system VapC family toxin [Verrucomicrobiota bacterium]MDY5598023.1 type II toxin-antitoxin system VapC family toxin [Kiritimatiellia bacterium]
MDYLLDTCALIWLGMGGGGLSEDAKRRISLAARLQYSSISAWELSRLQKENKIVLPCTPGEFLFDLSDAYGLSSISPDDAIMMRAAQLPDHHRDPADRIIIATALMRDLTVITGDEKFPQYNVRTIR